MDEMSIGINMIGPHILVDVVDNRRGQYCEEAPRIERLLMVEVDDYEPEEGAEWDVDEWEARKGWIFAPAARRFWEMAYSVARILSRPGGLNAALEIEGRTVLIERASVTVLS